MQVQVLKNISFAWKPAFALCLGLTLIASGCAQHHLKIQDHFVAPVARSLSTQNEHNEATLERCAYEMSTSRSHFTLVHRCYGTVHDALGERLRESSLTRQSQFRKGKAWSIKDLNEHLEDGQKIMLEAFTQGGQTPQSIVAAQPKLIWARAKLNRICKGESQNSSCELEVIDTFNRYGTQEDLSKLQRCSISFRELAQRFMGSESEPRKLLGRDPNGEVRLQQ